MVASKGISWPQIRDGEEGDTLKMFNVKSTPTYYLLDRQGKIFAKRPPAQKLEAMIVELLKR